MNILEQILEIKRKEAEKSQPYLVKDEPSNRLSLKDCLSSSSISVIAEIKMKSPSEGDILLNADPVQIAKDYESVGASAISVITDQQFFGGHINILKLVKQAVSIPVIRKDFIVHHNQILEAGSAGADAYLLIAEALNSQKISEFIDYGKELGLEALVEFHAEENTEIIKQISPDIVGVNCRDLKTMKTDINYFGKMINRLPVNSIKIAESGITTNNELRYVFDLGYNAVLVGTSLMKTGYPGKALEDLIKGII
ncbi:MAG: indole-3-glycerol phosphate synthase [Candidatus Marinimicrobia bacterium]|nr:indole-3-glycerol phosphate synthase [Candidatus Neomarinimicrobiota bacterium]|tara:strand:- start:655 stop:1416 length:762 start_codon:yes stop_codon:yes gene_type:complete